MAHGSWKRRSSDSLYVLLLGAGVAALAWLWRFELPPPGLAEDIDIAAGIRPPVASFGLVWHSIAGLVIRTFGIEAGCRALAIAGNVSLGVLAVVASRLFELLLPATLRRGERVAPWWRMFVRFVVFQGAVFFCCADPVWNAFRWFSPAALRILLAAFAALGLAEYFRFGRSVPRLVAFAILGLLATDTPAGAGMAAVAALSLGVLSYLRSTQILPNLELNPLARVHSAFRLTIAFLGGLALGMAVTVRVFGETGGLEAFGWEWGDYALNLPLDYLKAWVSSCSPLGWALVTSVVVLPLLVELELLRRATDADRHLLYMQGVAFAIFGLLSFSQLAGAKALWFWTWGSGAEKMRDGLLLVVAVFLCALSVVWTLGVFTMEIYLRNFKGIVAGLDADVIAENSVGRALASMNRMQRVVRAVFRLEPLLALACILPFRVQSTEHRMLDIVTDVERETVEECRGADYIFTDGGLDAGLEVEAAREGASLVALSLMGGAANPRSIYLRTRGATNSSDRALLEIGAADALRTWVRSNPEKASTYAVQIGFELWRRDGRPMPECSGLVARPAGMSHEEAERGAAVARGLARRVLELYETDEPDGISDLSLRDAFLFAQWRLAVLARHRANAYDGRGLKDLALEETRLADMLDRRNGALARIHATMAWAGKRRLERMTPQEGLRLGLAKADFSLARIFAQRVLDMSPDDPAANFALGMDYFVQKQYARAEAHLARCLEHRPDDPAVLNNLAQCHLRQGHPDKALPFAERALEILPDSPEVKRTVERVKAALEKRADKGASE